MELNQFILSSVELNLFFARIVKEHATFLQGMLGKVYGNSVLTHEAMALKNRFSKILSQTISLTKGLPINRELFNSYELVTDLTLYAERAAEFFSGIPINGELTILELSLSKEPKIRKMPPTVKEIAELNAQAIDAATKINDLLVKIRSILSGTIVFKTRPSFLIDHILSENRFYLQSLGKLQNLKKTNDNLEPAEVIKTEIFWNQNVGEHLTMGIEIFGLTQDRQYELVNLKREFEELISVLPTIQNKLHLQAVTQRTLKSIVLLKDIIKHKMDIILEDNKPSWLPLLIDHGTREINRYHRLLKSLALK